MSDVEKSFTFLHENIPQWFKNVAAIEERVVKMQDELSKVPMSQRWMPVKRKTGSVESIRDLDAIAEDRTMSTAQPGPFATRKRKTPSVLSGNASDPSKFRSRTMIVVYYDDQIQKSFEQLVRAIGTGRNMLRKGKMEAKMEAMAALADSDSDNDDDDDDGSAIMSKIGYRRRTALSSMRTRHAAVMRGETNDGSSTPVELFDTTDRTLESAQGLCEKGAHQSLRDGDCRKELDGVRRHFEEALQIAEKEVAKYRARKEQEQAAQQDEPVKSTPSPMSPPPLSEPKKTIPTTIPAASTVPTTSKVVEIEVDDDEEDDRDFVMPPIRLTSRV